jgi:hypothetical protein
MITDPGVDVNIHPDPLAKKKPINAVNLIAKRRPPPMNIGYSEYGI